MKALNPNQQNNIVLTKLIQQEQVEYYSYVPKQVNKILVLVHGISRNAEEIISAFKQLADTHGYLLIAPVFNKQFATDYQRLGRKGKGPRSDYLLMAIVNDCQSKNDTQIDTFDLFGFSAGAQYAHRFAFAHPTLVNKVALVAAGWYTLPTIDQPYPRGTSINKSVLDVSFEPNRYLRVNYKVYIGSQDDQRDSSLNKSKKIDSTQGTNRLTRAKNWVTLMQQQMDERNINNQIKLEILENVSHDFSDTINNAQLNKKVIHWLTQET